MAAIDRYVDEAGSEIATAFVAALEEAFGRLGRHPGLGSPRLGVEIGLPQVRTWPLAGFPYVVCYVAHVDHVDVWRVLHERSDLPVGLVESEE